MSDMQTMPVRDLITSMRDQIKNAPSENAVQLLVLGVLVRRIEEQADLADAYKIALEDCAYPLECKAISDDAKHPEDWDRAISQHAKNKLEEIGKINGKV